MKKICYVCGHEIKEKEFYYTSGPNFICDSKECFHIHFWDTLAARISVDTQHHFVIVNYNVYEIGDDNDDPRGFSGKHWVIQFNDGTIIETNSLWHRGKLPTKLQNNFQDNAKFI